MKDLKANDSRSGRLNFDAIADAYDQGRFAFTSRLVNDIARSIDAQPGDQVLEVGAGSGQLTLGLAEWGFDVTALEPGHKLAEKLRQKLRADLSVHVTEEVFEDFPAPQYRFASVWSANAFHWVDPDVSYRKAADLLRPGGSLVLIWSFPVLADDLQNRLNVEVFKELSPNLIREVPGYFDSLTSAMEEGRHELLASERFGEIEYWFDENRREVGIERYTRLLMSYGHMEELSSAQRRRFALAVHRVISPFVGDGALTLTDYTYVCHARR